MPKFKMLHGLHNQGDETEEGAPFFYKTGDVVESKKDLTKLHNKPGSRRFEAVPDDAPVTKPPVTKEEVALRRQGARAEASEIRAATDPSQTRRRAAST